MAKHAMAALAREKPDWVCFRPEADGSAWEAPRGVVRETIIDAVKAIARFIFEMVIWNFVFFRLGRVVMLAVAFGRYPARKVCTQSRGRIRAAVQIRHIATSMMVGSPEQSCQQASVNKWIGSSVETLGMARRCRKAYSVRADVLIGFEA
ncbi:hypothetical protein [Rhodanobacter sp. DHG33]|uniref:hypothetical protein n=1 Tax=Rhodanobacter sp. DHG33 TaxID=2775921 RepID=UPI001783350C|nr:hypothetical protein [Rhodanobacter sp. DHG33]MBD8900182.1 hypothetical protein [Rhodanobacter sp. DHG33]